MAKLNAKQTQLLRQLKLANQHYSFCYAFWTFIDSQASNQGGAFQKYLGPKGHLDPDKTKEDAFGRALFSLRESFRIESKKAFKQCESIERLCKKAKVPVSLIDGIILSPDLPAWGRPSVEKVLLHMQFGKPLSVAKKALREEIRTADPKTPQREINILQKYLSALEAMPKPPYQPPKRIIDYAKMRRPKPR